MKNKCRMAAILAALWMMVCSSAALADISNKMQARDVQENVLALCRSENDHYGLNEEVSVEDAFYFTLEGQEEYASDTRGVMSILFTLTVRSGEGMPDGVGITDYDFVLTSMGADPTDEDDFLYYWPANVYSLSNGRVQNLAWPVLVYDEPMQLVIEYLAPASLTDFAFVYTNMWEQEDGSLASGGRLKTYDFFRTVMDFNFYNNSGHVITGLYIMPEGEKGWGSNYLLNYQSAMLRDGKWIDVDFRDTPLESRTGEKWEFMIEFEDADAIYYDGVKLDDILEIDLHPSEKTEGRYTMTLSH